MRDPEQEEYRNNVVRYVDDVFIEYLDYAAGRVESQHRQLPIVQDELVHDKSVLKQDFKKEANFVTYRSQIHERSATCVKYSYGDIQKGVHGSLQIPYALAAGHILSLEDGLLKLQEKCSMVNRYNEAMAIGLGHNNHISMILSRKLWSVNDLLYYELCNKTRNSNMEMNCIGRRSCEISSRRKRLGYAER
jgi:hypothetical protein